MPSHQGTRTQRAAGSKALALAILLSLTLHLLTVSLFPWSWPEPSLPVASGPRMELRLQPQVRQKSPVTNSPQPVTTTPDVTDTITESEPDITQAPEEEISQIPPEPEPSPPSPEQTRALGLNELLRETVEAMENDLQQAPLGGSGPSIGDSAFDPRLGERIRQSEDINTRAPPKNERVRSWQEPGGDYYVEVGDGSCFYVRQSMQPGVPATWQFTRCRGREKLQLNPRPYTEIE